MCSTRSQVRFKEISNNSSDMWNKKFFFECHLPGDKSCVQVRVFSVILHPYWIPLSCLTCCSKTLPCFHWPTGHNTEQEDALYSLPALALTFTCQWLWSQPSFCREAESQVGNEATGALHWIFCAVWALHPGCWLCIPPVSRHQSNGAVISRCGQPEVSWWGWRNADDEHLVQSVAKACASDSRSNSNKLMNGNCSRDLSNGGDLSDVEFGKAVTVAFLSRAELYVKVGSPLL